MQGKHLYEYAIIRVVPRVEREEFINVGVILCAGKEHFIQCKIKLDKDKLLSLDPEADCDLLTAHLDSFVKICSSPEEGGPIAKNTPPARFRWLTAMRSSMIQTSRPHSGLTEDLEGTVERLFKENVL